MLKIVFALALVLTASKASAEGCPKKPVAEGAGKHWCYDAGRHGHVHLWKPASYDAGRAVTVVYLHGYVLGDDACPKRRYLDCAWDSQGLAKQFEASGLDALFVAVEGPIDDGEKPKWKSLAALLDSVREKGGIRPRGSVTLMAHSAGVFTAFHLMTDDRVAHLILLDAIYLDASRRTVKWFKAARSRRLTLVGAESCHGGTQALAERLDCATSDDLGLSLAASLKDARCAAVIDGTVGHMDLILEGHVIPMALSRTVLPKPIKPHYRKHHPKRGKAALRR